MPNRYLRETFIESERVNAVGFHAELLWLHLVVTVDDFGRCQASPKILRPRLFPLRLSQVREAELSRWIAECEKAGLLRLYVVDGKQYLQLEKWEQGRALKSKCPDPPADVCSREHLLADANIGKQMSPIPTPVPTTTPIPISTPTPPVEGGSKSPTSGFDAFWSAYPRRVAKPDTQKAWASAQNKCAEILPEILTSIAKARVSFEWTKQGGQFIPHPATWLNRHGWKDEYKPARSTAPSHTTTDTEL